MSISKACEGCKKPILSDGEFEGNCSFRIRCEHCRQLLRIVVERVTKVDVIKLGLILLTIYTAWTLTGLEEMVEQALKNILNTYAIEEINH